MVIVARQALTDSFHFRDDILSCLYSFPLELVSSLRRPTSHRSSVLEPSAEVGQVDCQDVNAVEDLLSDKDSEPVGDESATVDLSVDNCSVTVNSTSSKESVDMADCNSVSFFVIIMLSFV